MERLDVHDADEQNTLATRTGEDRDYIHMGEGLTGGNNQESGMTQTDDTQGRACDLKREESYFSK